MTTAPISARPSPISFDGAVSGLRTKSVVDKLIDVERGPIRGLQSQRERIRRRDQAYQDIGTRTAALQSAAQTLKLASATNSKLATSSNPSVVTATASPDAAIGPIQVSVLRLATSTALSSGGTAAPRAIGQVASTSAPLNSAGFASAVTAGSFTINGKAISIDPNVDSLTNVVSKINSAGAGVTASIVADAYGRTNALQLKSTTAGALIQLGSTADRSNFLGITGLVANGSDTVVSGLLGAFQPDAALSASRPGLVASFAATGSFTINGKSISYTSSDSLSAVLGRINSAGAGVTAAYDARTDRVTLTSTATGTSSIAVRDVTGNFLQAVGMVDASNTAFSQSVGQNAAYQLNGGPTLYSSSNTVTAALPGVNLNLVSAQPAGSPPVTITIGADTASTVKNLQAFATAYNDLAEAIDRATRYDPATRQPSPLTGDASILRLLANARNVITGPASKPVGQYRTLAEVGISTGPIGSKPGAANKLVVDAAKVTAALQANPTAVQAVVTDIATTLDTSLGQALKPTGIFKTQQASAQTQTRDIERRLAGLEDKVGRRQAILEKRFISMEKALARLQATRAYAMI
jgi:flagellar hook-associated protein 2